ncbi:MAG TPA: NAD(P)-binding domain-containing protein, partial [Acidimicrobiales bacterium]|nr:NAD(P)-binding domain-containing protein [Acidimicrobiales bacterium]
MTDVVLLDGRTARHCLEPEPLLDAISAALVAISRSTVSAPARVAARAPLGLLGAMPGYLPGFGLAAKLISVFEQPASPGRSVHRGVVALFDEDDGRLLCLIDAEELTALRTAAAATVAMRALARPEIGRIAVLGNGKQAAAQLELLAATYSRAADSRPELVIGARDAARAEALAARFPGGSVTTVEKAVREAEVVLCCTGASEPVVRLDWLSAGTHISSVGSGEEVDPDTVLGARLFVEWRGALTEAPPAGACELQEIPPASAHLVGEVLDGIHPGRRSPSELTL